MKLKYCVVGLILLSYVYTKSLKEFDEILIGEESEKVFHRQYNEGSEPWHLAIKARDS